MKTRIEVLWSPPIAADAKARLTAVGAATLLCPLVEAQHVLDQARAVHGRLVIADDSLGPALVMTSLSPKTPDALRTRAACQALTCALFEVPLGGGAASLEGGADAATAQAWAEAAWPASQRMILGGPSEFTGWMTRARGQHDAAAFSNRPVALGGLPEREGALARGALLAVQEFARRARLPRKTRVAIQGDGPGARELAALLETAGYLVARPWSPPVTDEPEPPPLCPEAAGAAILVVAMPWGLHPHNLGAVRPRLIVELEVGGVAAGLDELLMQAAVPVLPAALVRGGEALAAHLEWCHARGATRIDAEGVRNHLAAAFARVVRALWDESIGARISARQAALSLAARRLTDAWTARHG